MRWRRLSALHPIKLHNRWVCLGFLYLNATLFLFLAFNSDNLCVYLQLRKSGSDRNRFSTPLPILKKKEADLGKQENSTLFRTPSSDVRRTPEQVYIEFIDLLLTRALPDSGEEGKSIGGHDTSWKSHPTAAYHVTYGAKQGVASL